jgi:hypothetical protein
MSGSQQEGEVCLQALVWNTHIIVSDGVVEASVGSPQPNGLLVICPGCILLAVKIPNMYRLAACTSGCDTKLWHWHIQNCRNSFLVLLSFRLSKLKLS